MTNTKWVCGWGAAIDTTAQTVTDHIEDITFRYVIYPTMPSSAVRLRFSNLYGEETVSVDKVFVAKRSAGKEAKPGTAVEVLFGGSSGFSLRPGEECVSDPASFELAAAEEYFVSLYIKERSELRCGHWNGGRYITKYYSQGDFAGADDIPWLTVGDGGPYYLIHSIDYLTREDCEAIIAFGDSITAQPWPDCFARRLTELGIDNRSIIRRGIGGNRVLRDYSFRIKKHWGEAGVKRFEHAIETAAGASSVIVLHGINDIIHPGVNNPICPMSELPTAEELIEGYRAYIKIAHSAGMKIYFGTLLPCPRCLNDGGFREEIRFAANAWIRTSGEHDGVADFEAALRREDDPQQMMPEYDSGDHLHPSLAGAKKIAWSIPEEYFKS